jgi:(p)ppGpp synthase/HD superfamily hydrolase
VSGLRAFCNLVRIGRMGITKAVPSLAHIPNMSDVQPSLPRNDRRRHKGNPEGETMTDLIAEARAFAAWAHARHTRKGAAREPYLNHLEEVAAFTTRHGGDETTIAAAWLHDTVEDCNGPPDAPLDVRLPMLADWFGADVAALVGELTDDKALPKAERKRLQLANAPAESARATLLKLGDKASNVRAIGISPPVHWDTARAYTYVTWAESVCAALPAGHPSARAELAEMLATTRASLYRRA